LQCNRDDDLASPAKASALRSREAKPGTYQVMMYCVIKTPVKSSWHDSVEVFLLKGGINEAGWRRNGMMNGLQWKANKGGVTCESEDANHMRRQWISSSGRGQNRIECGKIQYTASYSFL